MLLNIQIRIVEEQQKINEIICNLKKKPNNQINQRCDENN